ncbi:helix-turn-helix domain-containing protein [Lentilactobacillus senioris]|uniref:helix-turn-helix domain-containing protein n=1 Tax=Lentilactobacillus senioris TaxID=931534 RepID=UPI0022810D92|nr:helix-turn-helix domain-containing protein [Lentilactobacillus senioris]MCY9806812.1 helix-turn-helix domain-containing protein [Lentilactobacillus senioris]
MSPDLVLLFTNSTEYRRPKVFENILNGKKTVSNLFWGLQYGLLPELGMLHGQNVIVTETTISALLAKGLIVSDETGAIKLTEAGTSKQKRLIQLMPPLAGDTTRSVNVMQFRDRFLLAAQVTSEYSYHNSKYYPLNIPLFDSFIVKRWFQTTKAELPNTLLTPLTGYLSELETQWADIFTRSLVGHQVGGQTYQQLGLELQVDPEIIELVTLHLYANFAYYLVSRSQQTLLPLVADLFGDNWTSSAQKTYQLFINQQLTVDQIAQRRSIKLSTVREHLLESAIWLPIDRFPYQQFLVTRSQPITNKEMAFFNFRLSQIYRSKLNE